MRIRTSFAASFLLLLLLFVYFGFSTSTSTIPINDKFVHFVTFFLLTTVFYWILEASRRRVIHLTLITVTLILGIGSEFLQTLLNSSRNFEPYDILANLLGSLLALILMAWYHKRMLERKRLAKLAAAGNYQPVATDEVDDPDSVDLEDARTSIPANAVGDRADSPAGAK